VLLKYKMRQGDRKFVEFTCGLFFWDIAIQGMRQGDRKGRPIRTNLRRDDKSRLDLT